MNVKSQPVFRIPCGDCHESVQIDLNNAVVVVKIPSNGKRGAGYVPAHWESADVTFDDVLAYWECPGCGYADSTYHDPAVRKVLA